MLDCERYMLALGPQNQTAPKLTGGETEFHRDVQAYSHTASFESVFGPSNKTVCPCFSGTLFQKLNLHETAKTKLRLLPSPSRSKYAQGSVAQPRSTVLRRLSFSAPLDAVRSLSTPCSKRLILLSRLPSKLSTLDCSCSAVWRNSP